MLGVSELKVFRSVTAYWAFSLAACSLGEVMFGMDGSAWGSLQVLPSFLKKFGSLNAKGKYAFSADRLSLMTSVQWTGKLFGTVIAAPLIYRLGFKKALFVTCAIQFLAVALEIAAVNWQMFAIGRVFCYVCIGLIENIASNYAAETSPADLRGFAVSAIWLSLNLGRIINQAIFRGISTSSNPKIWMAPVGAQFGPPLLIIALSPFIAESPRWLVARGKNEETLKQLNRLRASTTTSVQTNTMELEVIAASIEESNRLTHQGSWFDLFKGNNFRRTMIVAWIFVFQQWTGQQFVTAYGPKFLSGFGFANTKIFNLNLSFNIVTVFLSFPIGWMYDRFGRRPMLIYGTILATVFLIVLGTVGDTKTPTTMQINAVAAAFVLFQFFEGHALSQACYIIGSEIGTSVLRQKTMSFGTTIDVIAAFGVTYSSPYALATLGAKAVWIFVGLSIVAFFFIVFFVPETNRRSLEEMDQMFEAKLWAWQFSKYQTTGIAQTVHELEQAEMDPEGKQTIEEIELVNSNQK